MYDGINLSVEDFLRLEEERLEEKENAILFLENHGIIVNHTSPPRCNGFPYLLFRSVKIEEDQNCLSLCMNAQISNDIGGKYHPCITSQEELEERILDLVYLLSCYKGPNRLAGRLPVYVADPQWDSLVNKMKEKYSKKPKPF